MADMIFNRPTKSASLGIGDLQRRLLAKFKKEFEDCPSGTVKIIEGRKYIKRDDGRIERCWE
ncbi:MAG: hypothetical protein JXA43_01290 [Candidatus Diapherotrites archaeon]|nr:hypothetical protein [Candidatus Diapherotrites archaeon]